MNILITNIDLSPCLDYWFLSDRVPWSTFSLRLIGDKRSFPVWGMDDLYESEVCTPSRTLAHMFWVSYNHDIIFKTSFEESKKEIITIPYALLTFFFSWDKVREVENILSQTRNLRAIAISGLRILPFWGFRVVSWRIKLQLEVNF